MKIIFALKVCITCKFKILYRAKYQMVLQVHQTSVSCELSGGKITSNYQHAYTR